MNGKQYAEHLGVPHGTVKRWLSEGLPATRQAHAGLVHIDPGIADAWVQANKAKSISFARTSSVYFARRDDGAIKIGWTADVPRRLAELRKETGANVALLAVLPGDKPDELRLHARFALSRLDGEWFMPSEEIAAFLRALREVAA